ncbi:MAG: beta-eliminating lyase-related protein [Proteobacteria bacterium]|mgnify:FL=1|jgi:threonine aldolase|nr:beta-eliminating lyase-related protein [Pseudomonadota bacterium]MDA1286475.1 beta-eliminating lyase-related protein [Pseudomonadota bacterium]
MFFASDNSGPVAPEIMAALAEANRGYAMAYGNDETTARAQSRLRDVFEAPDAVVHFVITGTAANSLALATLANPWDAIFCHRDAHIMMSEANAPEFYSNGAKLVGVDGPSGKIDAVALHAAMMNFESGGVKDVQRGPVSLTQVTDLGGVYNLEEIRAVTKVAKSFDAPCHLDGARFANALVALGCTPAEMTWKSGIDAVSFGGTKNGLMGVEAVIFFDPARSREFQLRRMRGAHLLSKNRFLAAQMLAYLQDDLWLDLARKSNAAAARLERAVKGLPGAEIYHQRDANMIFAGWTRQGHINARKAGAAYYLAHNATLEGQPDEIVGARLVCNWATTDDDIASFVAAAHTNAT